MDDDARKMIESILERGFDRMETRFDGLAAEIRAHGTEIAVVKVGCARHAVDDEKRDKKISALWQKVGDFKDEVSQKPEPTAVDVVRLLGEREEARSKRMRLWIAMAVPVALTALGLPAVRGCVGEAQTERIAQSVRALEQKPATVVKVPVPTPVPVPVPSEGGE